MDIGISHGTNLAAIFLLVEVLSPVDLSHIRGKAAFAPAKSPNGERITECDGALSVVDLAVYCQYDH